MGLLPDQFWSLTPAQFSRYVDAAHERTRGEYIRQAFFTAPILNCWLKTKITSIDELLPDCFREQKRVKTAEELRQDKETMREDARRRGLL